MDEDLRPDIDAWARSNGFEPSDDQIGGTTPLLRLGMLDTTDAAYRGEIDGNEAILAEVLVDSPDWSEAFSGLGVRLSGFTVVLIFVDASAWPRLTVHPSRFDEHDWAKRLLRADHRVHTLSEHMDERYRVVASTAISADRLGRLFTHELIEWWLVQEPEVIVDIEDHGEGGGFLTVAHLGIGIGDDGLATLQRQAAHVLAAFAAVT
jgi:hypothetical protein